MPHKTYFSWSSGKDAALALYQLLQDPLYDVQRLITTVNAHYQRVSMHGLRKSLLDRQRDALGIPLTVLELPEQPSMEEYDSLMAQQLTTLAAEGYSYAGFGDIFLEDLKAYHDAQMEPYGIKGIYPIWKKDSQELIRKFMNLGFKAVIICAKAACLDESFIGREIDESFLHDLPMDVDPCGENGEFHTFCYDGPIFKHPLSFEKGEKMYREYKTPQENEEAEQMGFWFLDLV